jgi:hypothetical protein
MVRAILEGRKTQTRRVFKTQPEPDWHPEVGICAYEQEDGEPGPDFFGAGDEDECYPCPYGEPGDRLWVRETWAYFGGDEYLYQKDRHATFYRATYESDRAGLHDSIGYIPGGRWRPSIHMPRWASRLTLEILKVRVERVQDISEADAKAEGASLAVDCVEAAFSHQQAFMILWDKINAKRGFGWEVNPWVWVVEFKDPGREQA